MTQSDVLISPRLVRLQQEVVTQGEDALAGFWREVEEQGTPLIEPSQEDDEYSLTTFLWRAREEVNNVVVISQLFGHNFDSGKLTHLPNTDVWYKTCRLRSDLRTVYRLSPNDSLIPFSEVKDWRARVSTWQPDPLNPRRNVIPHDPENPGRAEMVTSVFELPAAPHQPWVSPQTRANSEPMQIHRLASTILGNERRIWIYTPPTDTSGGSPQGLLVFLDGWSYLHQAPTPTILDNLITASLIPSVVAVFVDSLDRQTREREMTCHPPLADFLAQELIPWVRQRYNVDTDPARICIVGSSFGGLAAAFVGLRCPEIFGNILSHSGTFDWKPREDEEHEWLTRQFAVREPLPLSFYLGVGLLEKDHFPDGSPSMLVTNRHMRTVLQAKGYSVTYAEYNGGHDYLCWQGTLADGLLALMAVSTD